MTPATPPPRYAIAIGSNRPGRHGPPRCEVVAAIAALGGVVAASSIIASAPIGPSSRRFANAAIIAVYTLIDGSGARASGNALSYVSWLIFVEGIPFVAWIVARRGRPAVTYLTRSWRRGVVGGACALAAYGIVRVW